MLVDFIIITTIILSVLGLVLVPVLCIVAMMQAEERRKGSIRQMYGGEYPGTDY